MRLLLSTDRKGSSEHKVQVLADRLTCMLVCCHAYEEHGYGPWPCICTSYFLSGDCIGKYAGFRRRLYLSGATTSPSSWWRPGRAQVFLLSYESMYYKIQILCNNLDIPSSLSVMIFFTILLSAFQSRKRQTLTFRTVPIRLILSYKAYLL